MFLVVFQLGYRLRSIVRWGCPVSRAYSAVGCSYFYAPGGHMTELLELVSWVSLMLAFVLVATL